ncbi:MAG: hypothetical protein ABIS50_22470 [Luteolibacter sp.]|uniref:hypothetical protein n=1 Tax=Luteolibacter sp. TaxID=1962973 RepID=UPI0032674561
MTYLVPTVGQLTAWVAKPNESVERGTLYLEAERLNIVVQDCRVDFIQLKSDNEGVRVILRGLTGFPFTVYISDVVPGLFFDPFDDESFPISNEEGAL